MNDQALLDALQGIDPIPDPERLLVDEVEAGAFLAAVEAARHIGTAAHQVRRPHRRWPVAVGAAAAALILMGGATLLPRLVGTDGPVASDPPAESTSVWSRIPHDEAVFGGEHRQGMKQVIVGGPGLVAVGYDQALPMETGRGDAMVWTSVDGVTWSRVPHDEGVFGGEGTQWMNGVTVAGPGLVAVGESDGDAAVWTSVDGIAWSRVPHNESALGGAGMESVTAGGPGLVAVGSASGNAAVWTSVDGITWSRVLHDESALGGEGRQWMKAVTVGGPGLVAVGESDEDAAVWTSVDGVSWSRVPHDASLFGEAGWQTINDVTEGGPGLVAVGADIWTFNQNAVVWTSQDGITWSRVPYDWRVLGGAGMQSVTAGGPGLVAVGWWARVWTSGDGITWSRVPYDRAAFGSIHRAGPVVMSMDSVIAGGPGLVAVGGDGPDGNWDAAVWNATAAGSS